MEAIAPDITAELITNSCQLANKTKPQYTLKEVVDEKAVVHNID